MPKSVFYYQVKASRQPDPYQREREMVRSIYHEHKGRYGYRRIHLTLRRKGVLLNHKTVQRLMSQMNLKSTVRPKKYRFYRGEVGSVAENILKRNFKTSKPNEKWVTDVTAFRVKNVKVYLSPIVDLFNQEVIAYKAEKNARLPLVTEMMKEAIEKLDENTKPTIQSDQGWQYQHKAYQKMLKDKGLAQSMSRKGNCLDNAVAENFFGLLKSEMYHGKSFEDADELIMKIEEYIEYYNTQRIKVKLKGLTPIEYRHQALQVA